VNIEAIRDSSLRIVGAVNVFREKPEQLSGQLRLDRYGRHSDELLQALPVAIYTTDAAGRITFCNEAAVKLCGTRQEPILRLMEALLARSHAFAARRMSDASGAE
jgi:PAS domain-containing protein